MPAIQTSLSVPTQPWETARARFLDGLSPQEAKLYEDATLENIFYDASSTHKQYTAGSRSSRLLDFLAPILESLEDYGKAMDVFVNTQPLILSPLWGGLRVILHIAGAAARFQERLIHTLAGIGDELPRYMILQKLYKNHEALLAGLASIYLEVMHFCVATKDLLVRARKHRIPLSLVPGIWKAHNRVLDDCMNRIRHQSKRVRKESGLAHMIESSNSHEVQLQNHALQLRNDKMRRRNLILSTLSVVNYVTKQTAFANLRHPGTCRWLQRNSTYTSWIIKQGASCLCCYGIPGAGKSVLAASLRDDLAEANSDRSNVLICYYFCDYSDIPSLEPANILQSFIKQGLEQLPWTTFGDEFECPFVHPNRRHTSLAESSRYLLELVKRYNKTYVLLDGIDELSYDSQISILELVNQMMGSGLDIKAFITSRTEEYRVKKALQHSSIIRLSEKHVDGDISLLINDKLSRLDPHHPILLDETLKNEVVRTLIDGAKGMFLWVRFQLYDIEEVLTSEAVRTTLAHLPKTLTETYQRIIERTADSPGGSDKTATMFKMFRWLSTARRPLRLEELEEAVALDASDTHLHAERVPRNAGERLVAACGNLAVHNVEDDTVVFAHHTVKQYLCSTTPTTSVCINLSEAEDDIGNMCLAYLSFSDFETQVTKTEPKLTMNQTIVDDMIWRSIPFGSRLRSVASTLTSWRRSTSSNFSYDVILAVPNMAGPSSKLISKYTLLEYIVEFWVSHTAHFRPGTPGDHATPSSSLSWNKFRRVALLRQLPFEFRPWNNLQHRQNFDCYFNSILKTIDHGGCGYSRTLREKEMSLSMFSWALQHAVGSVLALFVHDDLDMYFEALRVANSAPDIQRTSPDPKHVLEVLLHLTSEPSKSVTELLPGIHDQTPWTCESLLQLLHESCIRERGKHAAAFYDFLVIEFSRCFGPESWNQLAFDTVLLAVRSEDHDAFQCLYDGYIDTPQASKSSEQVRMNLLEAIFYTSGPFDRIAFFLLLRHYSRLGQTALWKLAESHKNDSVRQAIIVSDILRGVPLDTLVKLRSKSPVAGLEWVGGWSNHEQFWSIETLQGVSMDNLLSAIQNAHSCIGKEVASAVEAFSMGEYRLLANHDQYGVDLYEDGDKHLLQYDARLYEMNWTSFSALLATSDYWQAAEALVRFPGLASDVKFALILLASGLDGRGRGHLTMHVVPKKTIQAPNAYQFTKARWNIRRAVRKS